MKFLDTKSDEIFVSFAVEEYVSEKEPLTEPVFMLWHTPPKIVVGRYQNIHTQVNEAYTEKHNIPIVRRRSGGGAVFLDYNTWQYTYWIPDENHEQADFRKCSTPVLEALRKMGVPAEFNGRNDILADGKKICGNSRFCTKYGVLHHGTIIFDADIETMVRALNVSDEKIVSKGIESVRQRVGKVKDYISGEMDTFQFAETLTRFCLGDNYEEYQLDAAAWKEIYDIAENKFKTWDWIYGSNPKFEKSVEKRFSFGSVGVIFNVERERFTDFSFSGDFFSNTDTVSFCEGIKGVSYSKESVLKFLREQNINVSELVCGMTEGELISLIFPVE